jgi:hypothetical protein
MVAALVLEDCLRTMHQCRLQALTESTTTIKQADSLHPQHHLQGAPFHTTRLTSSHSSYSPSAIGTN